MSESTAIVTPATEGEPAEGTAKETEEATKTFTQADLDRVVEERLARERKRYADYDDLKAKAKAAEDAEEANASDLDKAVKAAREEVTAELTAAFNRERVGDKIDALAASKFADVEDARLRLAPRVEEFVKDGSVDTDAITKALDEVLEKHPHLAAAPAKPETPSASRAGIGTVGNGGKAKPSVSAGFDRLRSAYADSDA